MATVGQLLPRTGSQQAWARCVRRCMPCAWATQVGFGVDLVLGVPRASVTLRSPVLGASGATAATVANTSDPIGDHHFALNMSAFGAAAYAHSVARLLREWRVDHISVVGGALAARWVSQLAAFAAGLNRSAPSPTPDSRIELLIGTDAGPAVEPAPEPGSALQRSLLSLVDSLAVGPPLWDTWWHLHTALERAERFLPGWGPATASSPCARFDLGPLPIGRIGARADGGSASYPPWHPGSCTASQLGCGDALAAAASPACCPRQSRLNGAESQFAYVLALAASSPVLLGGSLLGLSNSLPSMQLFTLPGDEGALAYFRNPIHAPAIVLQPGNATGTHAAGAQQGDGATPNYSIICRGTSSTDQPRMFDYQWMMFIFNTAELPLKLTFNLSTLPLDPSAAGPQDGRDFMVYTDLGDGPSGAYFDGRPIQIGGVNGSALAAHGAWAVHVQRVSQANLSLSRTR